MINPAEDFAYISDENHALTLDERRDIARCIEDQGAGIVTLLVENAELKRQLAVAQEDAMTMAMRLLGESKATFGPETTEVMERWRPKAMKALRDAATAAAQDPQSKDEK